MTDVFEPDQIADDTGRFAILAMDQRDSLRRCWTRRASRPPTPICQRVQMDVIGALSPVASGVLTDAEYGVAAVRGAGALAPGVGLLIASEWSPQPE